jgi:hypothetical protein
VFRAWRLISACEQINRRFLAALERADDFVEAIGNCSVGAVSDN